MNTYIKPALEITVAEAETIIATSLPTGTPGANPGNSLVNEYEDFSDEENEGWF